MRLWSLLLAIACVALSSSAQTPRPDKKTDQSKTHETSSNIEFWFLSRAVVHTQPKESPAKDKAQTWYEWFWPPVWSNWALVAIGGIAARAAFNTLDVITRQANTMERQTAVMERQTAGIEQQVITSQTSAEAAKISANAAKASADALVNTERAWMILDKFNPTSPSSGPNNIISIQFRNCGRTPAWITNFVARYVTNQGAITQTINFDAILPQPTPGEPITTDAPTRWYGEKLQGTGDLSEAEFRSVRRGELTLYCFGILKYRDIFDKDRETRFCFIYMPPITSPEAWIYSGPADANKHT